MSLPGAITISRCSGPDGDYVSVKVEDRLSGITFVNAKMPLEAFGYAVTGVAMQPAELDLWRIDDVGKKYENKTVQVPAVNLNATAQEVRDALAPFEIDGWKADAEDMTNHHRRHGPATKQDVEDARKKNGG